MCQAAGGCPMVARMFQGGCKVSLSTGPDSKAMRIGELERLKHKIMHFAMLAPQALLAVRCLLAPSCRSPSWSVSLCMSRSDNACLVP